MKIKNEFVQIKIGEKVLNFNNLILNNYFKEIIKEHESSEITNWIFPRLTKCYLKFDTKMSATENTVFSASDFDIYLTDANIYEEHTLNKNIITYQYRQYRYGSKLSEFVGKKITALAFSTLRDSFCAFLDVSDYGIFIENNEDFSVVRRDIIETNGFLTSNKNDIDYPIHLSPIGFPKFLSSDYQPPTGWSVWNYAFSHLTNYGFGNSKSEILEEHELIKDNISYTDNSIIFNNLENNSNYKYIFFKFKIYHRLQKGTEMTPLDSDYWYILSMPIETNGIFNYAIKYERG